MQRLIAITALVAVATLVAIVAFCVPHRIYGLTDFRNYRTMRSSQHPIVISLADGVLINGSPESEMLAIAEPTWTTEYGRYRIHGYKPKGSYDWLNVHAVDGRIVAAGIGSCTWRWSFFYDTPEDVVWAAHALDTYRDLIERDPTKEAILKPCLHDVNTTLGLIPSQPEDGG